jgi:hypothetical protein
MNVGWTLRRAAAMGPAELGWRVRDEMIQQLWRRRWRRSTTQDASDLPRGRFSTPLPAGVAEAVPQGGHARLLEAADGLLAGRWPVLGSWRGDMIPAPDWFRDPTTGIGLARHRYCFDFDIRQSGSTRVLKPLWELSRHQHTTVLAAAYHLTGEERYARAGAAQLDAWWRENSFLSGPHWTNGIELGMRLISWVWARRLLDGWSGTAALFDDNLVFCRQLHNHHEYLEAFRSRGTSANNHLLAEAAGQFVASCAFPWFAESSRWRSSAAAVLEREVERQTFPSGLHRELASSYHAFAMELCLASALEGDASGYPLSDSFWQTLGRMVDAAAAVVDKRLRPPRQGDDDNGHGLLVDAPDFERWASLLATGEVLFGRADWWPKVPSDDVRTALWTALAPSRRAPLTAPPRPRPPLADAGMAILVADPGGDDELWCRLDHGPHGYLAIAAHAHADALAIELRVDGVEILADPGTYCYQGDREWRDYFRSTVAHNTLEVAGEDQSISAGPFLWSHQAATRLEHISGVAEGPEAEWRAVHDGYRRLRLPVDHRRTVRLYRPERVVEIRDELQTSGCHECRLTFHLGPEVQCILEGTVAILAWQANGLRRTAVLTFPGQLKWCCVRGSERPRLGWYSPSFGVRVPSPTLVGTGTVSRDQILLTTLRVTSSSLCEGASE